MSYLQKRLGLFVLGFLSLSLISQATSFATAEIEPKQSEAAVKLSQVPSTSGFSNAPGNVVAQNSRSLGKIAAQEGIFNTLLAAVDAAGVSDVLEGNGPLTLFAPNDAAFDALPAGVLDALLEPQNQGLLIDVLSYHILDSAVASSDLSDGPAKTMGGDILVDTKSSDVWVNDARVVSADVIGSNGVIHVIDKVLVPESVAQALSSRSSAASSSSSSSSSGSVAPAATTAQPVRGLW